MRHEIFRKIAVVSGDTPQEFEEAYNSKVEELGDSITDEKTDVRTLRAIIHYKEVRYYEETVRDEFHNEGLVYLCKQCPHIQQKDKRIKYVDCKYAEFGHTHLDHECCELFYKELKQGKIAPRYLR